VHDAEAGDTLLRMQKPETFEVSADVNGVRYTGRAAVQADGILAVSGPLETELQGTEKAVIGRTTVDSLAYALLLELVGRFAKTGPRRA
jgi:hypothetical protein